MSHRAVERGWRGQQNPFGAKGPWVEVVAGVARGGLADDASGVASGCTGDEGHVKPRGHGGYADLALDLGGCAGRAGLKTHLGLKPDGGKLNVRNFREGAGIVTMGAGLRPTAKAADMPPDPTVGAPVFYPAIGRMVSESPGRNASERELAPKHPNSGGRAVDDSAKAIRVVAVWLTRRHAPAGLGATAR